MAEYIYRIADQNGRNPMGRNFETFGAAQRCADDMNRFNEAYGVDLHHRVQRAAVVWEDIDNG